MSAYPIIIHHGGGNTVTGSCHELRVSGEAGILVDCGLFQGEEESTREAERRTRGAEILSSHPKTRAPEIDFPVTHLRSLVVTHVHLDHVGRIPHLLAAGFAGPIVCSEPSAVLLPLILEDALKVGVTRDRRLIESALGEVRPRLVPLPYGRWHDIPVGEGRGLTVKLQPAGHILGSAYVEVRLRHTPSQPEVRAPDLRILFSGDLGAPHAPAAGAEIPLQLRYPRPGVHVRRPGARWAAGEAGVAPGSAGAGVGGPGNGAGAGLRHRPDAGAPL